MSRILIIEEDLEIASALEIRFKSFGHEVDTAADAIVGGTFALQLKPDLICLNISLPDGIGFRLAEELRRRRETKFTPLIFLGACNIPELKRQYMQMGAAAVFEKHFEPDELVQVAGHVLKESLLHRAGSSAPKHFNYT